MKISELKRGNFDSIEGEISALEEPQTITTKFGKEIKVANGTLTDDSGEIKIALWGEDTEKYSKGDRIRITNGWVSEFKGELKVSSGKNGTIEKV